jgi:predicted dehydrogenase
MKPIKIAQIGIGHEHASVTMQTLRDLPECFEVIGLACEPKPVHKTVDHPAYQGIKQMSVDELLATPGLQAVAIESNMKDASDYALQCMQRNLHIHLDKPGGEAFDPFKQLVDGCRQRDLILQLGYMYRNNVAINFCFDLIRKGILGDIFAIDMTMSWDYEQQYRDYIGAYPGCQLYNLGSHLVDLIVLLMGRPDDVTTFRKMTRDDGLYDNGLAVLEYPRATCTVRSSLVEAQGIRHRRQVYHGTRGTAEIYPPEKPWEDVRTADLHVRLTLQEDTDTYHAGTQIINVGPMIRGRYEDHFIEFARAVNGEIENPYSLDHELLTQEVVLAASGYTTWKK